MFHDRASAEAAVQAHAADKRPLWLLTPPGAAGQGGPAYYREIVARAAAGRPGVEVEGVLDCGDDAALAHFALGMGWRHIVLRGPTGMRARIAAIAAETGAEVHAQAPKVT